MTQEHGWRMFVSRIGYLSYMFSYNCCTQMPVPPKSQNPYKSPDRVTRAKWCMATKSPPDHYYFPLLLISALISVGHVY